MVPFFRIRVELNPPDGSDSDCRDRNSLGLAIAQQCRRDGKKDDNADFEDIDAVAQKAAEAITWLAVKLTANMQKRGGSSFIAQLIYELHLQNPEALREFLENETETGDADWGDLIRKTAEDCKEKGI